MADPICFPDTLSIYLQSLGNCRLIAEPHTLVNPCAQIESSENITLNRVYNSQVYWNSTLDEVTCYLGPSGPWFYMQFHLYCSFDVNDAQTFRLVWCWGHADNARHCDVCWTGLHMFTLESFTCDPLSIEFSITANPDGCCRPTDYVPNPDVDFPFQCDFYATVTE